MLWNIFPRQRLQGLLVFDSYFRNNNEKYFCGVIAQGVYIQNQTLRMENLTRKESCNVLSKN